MLKRTFTVDTISNDLAQTEHSWMGIVLQFNVQISVAMIIMSLGWLFELFPVQLGGTAMLAGSILGFIGERDKQRTLQAHYVALLEAKAARLAPKPVTPAEPLARSEPNDGGETPSEAFLGAIWEHFRNLGEFPDVRNECFQPLGISKTRAGKMFIRIATWGAVAGRVEGGVAGKPADGWTLARCLHEMFNERPELLPVQRG